MSNSVAATTGTLVVVYGAYFAVVARLPATTPADQIVYQPLMIAAVLPLVVLAVASHLALALVNPREAGQHDKRERLIALRGERAGGYVLAVGVFTGLVLAMAEADAFWIAHALLVGWVLAELTAGAVRILLYRRGGSRWSGRPGSPTGSGPCGSPAAR
jgi:hypothetical protein